MDERFPAEVAEALRAGGWDPDAPDKEQARAWGLELAARSSVEGLQHAFFPAAEDALAEFGGVRAEPTGPGAEVAASGFTVDPTRVVHTHATLAAFGGALGAPLFPLGEEDGSGALLAIDENGRVFVLDHTAEWFLGTSPAEAWSTLLLGRRPARVRDDGTWA